MFILLIYIKQVNRENSVAVADTKLKQRRRIQCIMPIGNIRIGYCHYHNIIIGF